ncbi:MAG: hypothetical protein BLM47_12420 [Candidatus Reconcilbacillus cellulovorans]|uniref:CAAX prenyl protease 2/Lysostaphin resistance protein A-like domain-containing protein n=1 Tax=Candidatus Reconcilbacillus cellulovorans TaxID=1906605 RepID=A0A2A6DXG1_9BACL|nr:MAG: hypothetical protein BLM47_12420 [Candidatus Reconcilbacillus cellulovorans]
MKRKGHKLFFDYLAACLQGIAGLVLMWAFHIPWSALLDVGSPWKIFGLGTIAAFTNISFLWLIYKLFPKIFVNLDEENQTLAVYLTQLSHVHLFSLMSLTSLAEEIFFRAFIQTLLIQWWSSVPLGIGGAAAVFTALHVRFFKTPGLLLSGFMVGLSTGFLFWYTGNIWASVWGHFLYNVLLVIISNILIEKRKLVDREAVSGTLPGRTEFVGETKDVPNNHLNLKRDWKNQWSRFVVGFMVGLVITIAVLVWLTR